MFAALQHRHEEIKEQNNDMDCDLFMLKFERDSLELKLDDALEQLEKASGAIPPCEGTQDVRALK